MPALIAWEVNTRGADNTLNLWGSRLRNAQPAFNEIAGVMAGLQKDWFATEGQGSWAPLSPKYAAWKKKHFPKRGILHGPDRRGHKGLQLRDQLTKRPFGYERITRHEFIYGSTLDYSKHHRLGAGNMPARDPLVPLTPQTIKILQHIIQVHIVGETIGRR